MTCLLVKSVCINHYNQRKDKRNLLIGCIIFNMLNSVNNESHIVPNDNMAISKLQNNTNRHIKITEKVHMSRR